MTASYSVVFKPSVQKDLRGMPRPVVQRIFKAIETLKEEPSPRQTIKLTGAEQLYRIRVGDYRVIYAVATETSQVVIHHVRHRQEGYRQL